MPSPIPFTPDMEQPAEDEAHTQAQLTETLRGIIETTWQDYGHAVRSVHAKSHGLLQGRMQIGALPPELAQGLFATPGQHDVVLRLSTNPGDLLDDSVSTPRGLALKVMNVEGERLPGAPGQTQDFVMADAPAFQARDAKQFLGSLKLLAKTTDTPQYLKKTLSAVLRGAETVLETLGTESATLKGLGGHAATHILGARFFTQVPVLFGRYVAKLSMVPVSPELLALQDQKLALRGHPNALRDAVNAFFAAQAGVWELRAQLLTDRDAMPVEDASVPWPETLSPYRTVATIHVPEQPGWDETRERVLSDGLAFSPWHGLTAHRPLGSIMRARKPAYEMSSGFRASHNRCPIHEPSRPPM